MHKLRIRFDDGLEMNVLAARVVDAGSARVIDPLTNTQVALLLAHRDRSSAVAALIEHINSFCPRIGGRDFLIVVDHMRHVGVQLEDVARRFSSTELERLHYVMTLPENVAHAESLIFLCSLGLAPSSSSPYVDRLSSFQPHVESGRVGFNKNLADACFAARLAMTALKRLTGLGSKFCLCHILPFLAVFHVYGSTRQLSETEQQLEVKLAFM